MPIISRRSSKRSMSAPIASCAKAAIEYTTATNAPMPKLVCVSSRSRSSKTLGIATVVELKITPPQAVATSRMAKMRAMVRWSMCRPIDLAVFFTGPGSGTISMNATPTAMAAMPGTKKAARQPQRSIKAPEMSAAAARPRLPHSPFQPSAAPSRVGAATSMAMPTG